MKLNELNEAQYYKNKDRYSMDDFVFGKTVRSQSLQRGMILGIGRRSYNNRDGEPEGVYEILGFTGNEQKYGEGGVKYNSAKEMYAANNVRSLRELEAKDDENEYGYHHYIYARDLTDGDSGPWWYIMKGKWCEGSSAEPIFFREAKFKPKEDDRGLPSL